ncbi:SMI1/KNR4 family protein [Paenimyroides aestuarii]|uniref:SMI1/KNR4 family protein n=1 Tax=Paenimyroides aestuarii TaxID=2968490 RepID=A0ABY5NRP8_9FLAO|nr:SMI1/KNR4 family protein [Paenimyroides aestuarii]UUV21249.1 SMI1/KNR4 family protein [Paenimyroides aestuarii]
MSIKSIPYNAQLQQLQLTDIPFNPITLDDITEPFYRYEGSDEYDKKAFRTILLAKFTDLLGSNVLKLMIITPKDQQSPFDGFAFLANQNIVAIHIPNSGNFKRWMDDIFKESYEDLEEDRADGIFERQPELNPNPQFLLELGRGSFSIKMANSGMLFDEKPYENTGAYLHKKAPAEYNQAALTNEKDHFIKIYTKPNAEIVNAENLEPLFQELLQAKNLLPNEPEDNQKVFVEFESLANYKFPEALKTLLKWHNGIENTGFLSAAKILAEWKIWKGIYDDPNWTLQDLTGNNQADGLKTIGVYTNPFWVPFYSTGGGNFYAIDYAPGVQGTPGQIIAFGADEVKIRWIAPNLEDFLRQLISGSLPL